MWLVPVRGPLTTVAAPTRQAENRQVAAPGHRMTGARMQDLVFVILTIAFFALTALILKGVERL